MRPLMSWDHCHVHIEQLLVATERKLLKQLMPLSQPHVQQLPMGSDGTELLATEWSVLETQLQSAQNAELLLGLQVQTGCLLDACRQQKHIRQHSQQFVTCSKQ